MTAKSKKLRKSSSKQVRRSSLYGIPPRNSQGRFSVRYGRSDRSCGSLRREASQVYNSPRMHTPSEERHNPPPLHVGVDL